MITLLLSMTIVLLFGADVGAGCKVTVDCAFAAAQTGVTVMDCPTPPPPGPPGPAGSAGVDPVDVICCQEYNYTGPEQQRYLYNGTCPVALEFTTLDLEVGETLVIRNIFCDTDPDDCQMYVIDHTAVAPMILLMSNSNWKFSSSGADVLVTFHVKNFECNDCLPDDEQVECRHVNWIKYEDICYYIICERKTWEEQRAKCEIDGTNNWQAETINTTMARLRTQAQWDYIKPLMKERSWLGLHCVEPTNTQWYWDIEVGHNDYNLYPNAFMLNTFTSIWDSNYPWAGANAHCAYVGPGDKEVENTNCDTHFWGLCEQPAP